MPDPRRTPAPVATPSAAPGFWQFPWGYGQALALASGMMTVGFLLEVMLHAHGAVPAPGWPVNGILLVVFTAGLILPATRLRTDPIIQWLSDVPMAIVATGLVTALALIGGIVPQTTPEQTGLLVKLGFNDVFHGWPFILSMLLFLSVLGLVVIKKIVRFQWKTLPSLLNHLGLWLAFAAAFFGSADMRTLTLQVREGNTVAHAVDQAQKFHELPFAVHLKEFNLEYYPLTLSVQAMSGEPSPDRSASPVLIQKEHTTELGNWMIEVLEYHPHSLWVGKTYEPVYTPGAFPAARIKARNRISGAETEGWISCGSATFPPRALDLVEARVQMDPPQPRTFQSQVTLLRPDGQTQDRSIEVNHPVSIAGWRLYQYAYDRNAGPWSTYSVFQAVQDPWLPAVYGGLLMLLAGALLRLVSGQKKNQDVRS